MELPGKKEAAELARKHMAWAAWFFGVDHWEIALKFETVVNGKAQVYVRPLYRSATITFDLNDILDEEDLVKSLCHELLHIALGDYQTFMENVTAALTKEQTKIVDACWTEASERTVAHFERILDLQGFTAKRLPAVAKELKRKWLKSLSKDLDK